ncbi:putative major pilin subunit [compost metagenome]|uniref:type IV pilin protein n=1 Tax=Stenotrophomonas TaxID=40323 RepID=UPI000FC0CA53|nr:type IV pilin protein [Stenotrophomonas sp. PA-6-5C]MCF5090007.1 prepilin-type N-terminal cleavage/methylation domain-containing protein [Stenotrophomonas sp. PA-6-5C]
MRALPSRRLAGGFNLIELMLVIGVIAVLSAIAYPSYLAHVRKTHRTAVKADMVEYAQRAERQHSSENSYASFKLPYEVSPREGGTARYKLAIDAKASTFKITATPQGTQTKDSCGTLTLDQANRKTAEGTLSECW